MIDRVVLLMAVMVAAGGSGRAQGTLVSGNRFPSQGIDAPIFDASGTLLQGASYLAALYGTQNFADPVGSLQPSAPLPFANGVYAGYFGPQVISFPNILPDLEAIVQVRAWDSRLGATYEDVVALGLGGYGESALLHTIAGGGTAIPGLPDGLESFSLRAVVPEPNAGLLLLLGVPWLIWRCRRGRDAQDPRTDRDP